MKHFNYISFWWVSHGVPLKTLAFNLCLFFWFPIRAFHAYIFGTFAQVKSKLGHLCMNMGPHENTFNYISFWWVSHGVPLKTLDSTCANFLVHALELLMHIFFGPVPNISKTGHFVHEPCGPHETFQLHFCLASFLMEYHWRPCIQLVRNFFGSPLELFDAYFFWTFAK